MWRGNVFSSTHKNKGGGGGNGLLLECETEELSDAQLTCIKKIKDEVARLQNLIQTNASQVRCHQVSRLVEAPVGVVPQMTQHHRVGCPTGKILPNPLNTAEKRRRNTLIQQCRRQQAEKSTEITVPVLVNGTSASTVSPITNGPSMVGLQVPQFLLLQNGQMIAASSALQPATITNSSQGNNFTSAQGNITFKTTTTRAPSTHLTQTYTRTQRNNAAKSNSKSAAVNTTTNNNSSDGPEIQVLSEMRVSPQVNATITSTSSMPRGLRDVRMQSPPITPAAAVAAAAAAAATATATTTNTTATNTNTTTITTTTNKNTTTFKPISSISSVEESDLINGVTILSNGNINAAGGAATPTTSSINMPPTCPIIATTTAATPTTITAPATSSSVSTLSGLNKYPLLNIIARPRNTLPPSVAMSQRKELDTKVKLVLVKSPQEFVEWLLSEGMIRTSQSCAIHQMSTTQQPFKLKLGMFSDPKALATSGGYVWISECCGKKYISVYSGSIFGSTPIDKVAPTSVLKLVYHWGCQTSINNVESWVKVDKSFINKMYQYLRCVCSVMLQDKVYDFGFDGTTVELGIVSLGTSTADGTKKAVKVEILGLFDRKMKSYRLFASEPEPGSSSRQRFVRILKPLERVVHNNALILCDQSVDRNCLYNMNYGRVGVCETSDNEDNPQFNAKIMTYLRKHVPKMFQSALSQLNLQQVQLVLDELCWRERYGHSAAQAYSNMVEHIIYLTAREAENPGVLNLLDFVAQSPQHNWRYKSQHVPKGPTSLQPSIIMNPVTSSGPIVPQITLDPAALTQTPLDHNNKVLLTTRRLAVIPSPPTTKSSAIANMTIKADSTEMEPFYYGQVQGDVTLGREINVAKFLCHICTTECENNIEFYTHLKSHLTRTAPYGETKVCCDYCVEHFSTEEKKIFHQRVKHMHLDGRYLWCRICSDSFSNEYNLVNHMAKKHYESELPYRCEVCNFMTSIFYSLIDHFNVEHKNTCYVQCHFCLAVKSVSPATSNSFSHRVYQHLQRHAHQQCRCKQCQLNFYSAYLRDEHRKKDHISRVGFPGLQRYKIPFGQKTRIMFRPWIKKQQSSSGTPPSNPVAVSPTLALSSTVEWHDIKLDAEARDYRCIECKGKFSLVHHFKSYVKCTRCNFSTCCKNTISKHSGTFHPQGRHKKITYKLGPPIVLPKPLYCICGFSSRSGNHLARHLSQCEGGRKSAYKSVSDAMVYHGDVTGGMLANLDNLALSSIPGIPITNAPFDMSHFMSMSMEVDES